MRDIITCPNCQKRLRLADEYLGQHVECAACAARFVAQPDAPARPASTPPPPDAESGILDAELYQPAAERPRARRRSRPLDLDALSPPSRPSTSRARYAPWVIGALVVGGIVLGILAPAWQERDPAPRFRPAFPEAEEQRRQEILEAFRRQKPLTEEEIAKELRPLFERLGEAFRAGDARRIIDEFDIDRLCDELMAQEAFARQRLGPRADFVRGLRVGMGRGVGAQAPFLAWSRFEIKHIKKLEANEAVVIIRHRHDDGNVARMRWWVTKQPGTWRVFDFEDLDVSMRMSTTVAGVLEFGLAQAQIGQAGLAQVQQIGQAIHQLQDAMMDVAMQHNADAAEKKLQAIAGTKLPAKLEALRFLAVGLVHQQRGQAQQALDAFNRAHGFHADMPGLNLLKGIVFNDLRQWDQALKHLEAYRALLGDDAVVCQEIGDTLSALGRRVEACASYRKALDDEPKNFEIFLRLIRHLPPDDDHADLGARLAKLENPRQSFETCAHDCQDARDGATLEPLALAMRKIDPGYAGVDYYLALVKAWDGRTDQAVPSFQTALRKEGDADRRREYANGFLKAMAEAGKATEGYAAAAEAREAFRVLAEHLTRTFQPDDLRRLVILHRQKHADEPLLPFYEGVVRAQQGQYALAEKSFALGMAKPPDKATLDQFRLDRVLARYHTGQGMSAYAEIGPRHETFSQLMQLCFDHENHTLLEKLLDAHAQVEPESLELLRSRIRLRIQQKRAAEGVTLFKAALAKQLPEEQRRSLISSFLFEMFDAGMAVEGYQAAPDAAGAFRTLAEDCVENSDTDALRRLIAAHRDRQPNDPQLAVYEAEVCVAEKAWQKAAEVLGRAVKTAPADLIDRVRGDYEFAMYKAGRALDAYEQAQDKTNAFARLANLMVTDKKLADLEALLAAHRLAAQRLAAPEDGELLHYEARAKILAKRPAEAIPVFQKAYAKGGDHGRRNLFVTNFVLDMHGAGHGLDGYRAAPDKRAAFDVLARRLVEDKKDKELDELIQEHQKHHPDDPWLALDAAELLLLRGDAKTAAERFAAARAKASRQTQWLARDGLLRARIRAGQAVAAYQELGPGTRAFEDLARLCVRDKNPNQLEALIAAHRQADPDDPHVAVWVVEAKWLKQDYEGALKALHAQRDGIFAQPRHRLRCGDLLVRCLIKLKRYPEAIREAEDSIRRKRGDKVLLVLAQAAQGDVKATMAALDKHGAARFLVEDCYRDPDLGPILRSDAFRAFRERFPEPSEQGRHSHRLHGPDF